MQITCRKYRSVNAIQSLPGVRQPEKVFVHLANTRRVNTVVHLVHYVMYNSDQGLVAGPLEKNLGFTCSSGMPHLALCI